MRCSLSAAHTCLLRTSPCPAAAAIHIHVHRDHSVCGWRSFQNTRVTLECYNLLRDTYYHTAGVAASAYQERLGLISEVLHTFVRCAHAVCVLSCSVQRDRRSNKTQTAKGRPVGRFHVVPVRNSPPKRPQYTLSQPNSGMVSVFQDQNQITLSQAPYHKSFSNVFTLVMVETTLRAYAVKEVRRSRCTRQT